MEPDVLERFYRQYQRELYLYLCALCRSEAQAEDLLQETFLKALLSLPEGHGNVRAWLYRVGRNLYFDQCRHAQRLPEPPPLPEPEGPLEQLLTDERSRVLYQCLGALEERKREVLQLQYFSGLSQREIAAVLGKKPEYVRVLAHRARLEARAWMEEHGYELS